MLLTGKGKVDVEIGCWNPLQTSDVFYMMFHQKSSRTNHHESLWLATEELGPSPTILCASLVVLDLSLGRHEKDCDEIAAQSSGFVNPRFLLSVIPSEKLWNSHLLGTSSPFGVGIMSSPRPVSVRLAWILPISAAAWLWKFIYGTVVTSRFTVCFHCTGRRWSKIEPTSKKRRVCCYCWWLKSCTSWGW